MILDELTELADAATLVGTAASVYVLGDVIDTGAVSRNLGVGFPVRLRVDIDTLVAATGGASNVTFKIVSSAVAALTTPTVHWSSGAIAKGTLVAGYVVVDTVLPNGTYLQYLGVTYTPDTNDTTSGKANAYLVYDTPANAAYPNAI